MTLMPTIVSDHAVMRYLERVRGVDMDAARAEITGIVRAAVTIKASKFTHQGFTYLLEGRNVITVYPRGKRR